MILTGGFTAAESFSATEPASLYGHTQTANTAVTEAQAKEIALQHAGILENQVNYTKVKLDYEHGRLEYDIKLYCDGVKYEYDIDAQTGEILSFDRDMDRSNPGSFAGTALITGDQAFQTALKHAGVSKNEVFLKKLKTDYEHGRQVYEIKFYAGNMEYKYEIDAVSGEILKFKTEIERAYTSRPGSGTGTKFPPVGRRNRQ